MSCEITSERIVVTNRAVLGKAIYELPVIKKNYVVITRVSRAEVEFVPPMDFRLQFGDTLLVVGEQSDIDAVALELGNSARELNTPQLAAFLTGLAVGIVLGSCPIAIPGLPSPIRLGPAGGPLLAGIIFSRLGNLGPLVWHMPAPANSMLREFGIVLFLASVGLRSGDRFWETLVHGQGLLWMVLGMFITLVPLIIVGVFARRVVKLNFASLAGLLAGSMTDPPALAFAGSVTASDAPYLAYATVYPLVMILRIACAQIMVVVGN